MKIDPSKKYKTRDGREVTLLHRSPDGWPSPYPWRGLVNGAAETWDDDGFWDTPEESSDFDLVEDREPREWKACVRKRDGELYKYDPGDEGDGYYEVVRVREIIDP